MRTILAISAMAALAHADTGRDDASRKLETMKVTVDFQDIKLAEALDYLRDVTGLNFVIHARSAEQGDFRVRLKANDLSVKSTLKLLLSPKGLTVSYRDGALVVLPQEDLQDNLIVEIYDVRSQLVKLQDFPGPRVELTSRAKNSVGPIMGIELIDPKDPPVPPEFLVQLVRENTGGRSWERNASIEMKNGLLVVSQSPSVHREIKVLLAKLAQYQ